MNLCYTFAPIWEFLRVTRLDESGILALLHDGQNQSPLWSSFLRELQRSARADAAQLLFCHGAPHAAGAAGWQSCGGPGRRPAGDAAALNALRPSRVYSFEEFAFSGSDTTEHGAVFGRAVRVGEDGVWSAWLIVRREQSDFTASDSVLLSALAPHLTIAMRTFSALERQRQHAEVAQTLLYRLGITFRLDDGRRQVDEGRASPSKKDIERAIAKLTSSEAVTVVGIPQKGDTPPVSLLSIPAARTSLAAEPLADRAIVIRTQMSVSALQARYFEDLWCLSQNEARLTAAIANGLSLVEAAEYLGLTAETARNYSKRIYAKTGARGLADLVRLALNSVAVLA